MSFPRILALSLVAATGIAAASSHREAPYITEHAKVDGTDFYMFRSYESGRDGYVTVIANYVPLQDPYGGPNYFFMDPDALYEIHIDNNGDAVEDLTFQFRFNNNFKSLAIPTGAAANVTVPLMNIGPIGPGRDDTGTLNMEQTYTVTLVNGDRRTGTTSAVTTNGSTTFKKPMDFIGEKSFVNGDYASYANDHIYTAQIPGCNAPAKVFVGQRAEGFVVNLGEVFDLVNLNPLGARDSRFNTIGDKNVTSLALELPISCVTAGNEAIIGGWTTSSLRQARLINSAPNTPNAVAGSKGPSVEGGAWTQVSRLGSPLVNEVVIGLDKKDLFNASEPKDDLANFATFVTNPTLPVLVDILFFGGNGDSVPATPRNDLVAAFVTGITANVNGSAFNFTQPATQTGVGEMLRLNTAVGITPTASQNDLGFLGCDLGGFPNGRRPVDDVVDIALTVAEGAIDGTNKNSLQTCDVSGPTPTVVNSGTVVNDGALPSAAAYLTVFPYLNTPVAGATSASTR